MRVTSKPHHARRRSGAAPSLGATALALVLACSPLAGACKGRGSTPEPDSRQPTDFGASTAANLIVVLGSSTAAGIGPSEPGRAWVPRYARYLSEQHPDFRVLSLAVGGQTTYHIQPTGFVPPAGRPAPAQGKNVTAALELSPRALVINMPSNDAAERYSVEEQLANFERVFAAADAAHVPVWVTTTQPRNFGDGAQLAAQVEVKDAILRRFTPRTLDFWTPFATPTRKLAARFDAGDGTHLNDDGHALLLERVVAAGIPRALSAQPSER